jgi:hypothetical protein
VTVRLGGTPAGFTLADRRRPLQRPIRVYLVRDGVAAEVRGRFDPRLHFVGTLVPDRSARGVLEFTVPPLDTGTYAVAAWCPGCARYSLGRAFFTLPVPRVSRYREHMGLRIAMPPAADECPVTISRSAGGWYGNGLLWTHRGGSGDLPVLRRPDGTLFQKLGWLPGEGFRGDLRVRGERLDAASPPLRVLNVFWGYGSSGPTARGSWATPVEFPSEGCWRITARVDDVTLSYVARVVAR